MLIQVPEGITLPDYAETADPVSESESRQQQSGTGLNMAAITAQHTVNSLMLQCWPRLGELNDRPCLCSGYPE